LANRLLLGLGKDVNVFFLVGVEQNNRHISQKKVIVANNMYKSEFSFSGLLRFRLKGLELVVLF
jgi:hypothetical protein